MRNSPALTTAPGYSLWDIGPPGSSYHPVSTSTTGSPYGVAVCDGKTEDGI